MDNNETEREKEKKTWYELHKEQVKLIQFLLYHLTKYERKPEPKKEQPEIKQTKGSFIVKFD